MRYCHDEYCENTPRKWKMYCDDCAKERAKETQLKGRRKHYLKVCNDASFKEKNTKRASEYYYANKERILEKQRIKYKLEKKIA